MSIPATAIGEGVVIVRAGNNCFGVAAPARRESWLLKVEVDHEGRRYKEDWFDARGPYRDSLAVDLDRCKIRVVEPGAAGAGGDRVLCELGYQPQGDQFQPWMVVEGEQAHVTESSVSVPPALHVTDERGARWTLGFRAAPGELAPAGEFAFRVLRDGLDTGEWASRIERRGGQVRIFTRHGWRRWLGLEWS